MSPRPPIAVPVPAPLYRRLLAASLIALSSANAAAELATRPLDFALHLSRLETELHSSAQILTATVKQAGIAAFDAGDPSLQPGLFLGYSWIDLAHRAPTTGLQAEGVYLGPALRNELVNSGHLRLHLTAAYVYQRVRDSGAGQTATLEWYQPQLDLDGAWRISRHLTLLIGGRYGRVDGDEKLSGNVTQTLNLDRGATLGSRAGLELDLSGDGRAGILVHQALGDGVEFYFQRRY